MNNSFSDYLNEALDAAKASFFEKHPDAKFLPPITEEQQIAKDLEAIERQRKFANNMISSDGKVGPERIADVVRRCGRLD